MKLIFIKICLSLALKVTDTKKVSIFDIDMLSRNDMVQIKNFSSSV